MKTHTIRALVLIATLSICAYADDYTFGPDSQRQPNVPVGKVTKYSWTSTVYPGTRGGARTAGSCEVSGAWGSTAYPGGRGAGGFFPGPAAGPR